jgi:hypothetical protein
MRRKPASKIDIGLLARLLGEELLRYLADRGAILQMSSVPPPDEKEATWGGREKAIGSSDPIRIEENSDSSSQETMAQEWIDTLRRKKKRGDSGTPPRGG